MESRLMYIGLYPMPPPKKSSTGYPNWPRANDRLNIIIIMLFFMIIGFSA